MLPLTRKEDSFRQHVGGLVTLRDSRRDLGPDAVGQARDSLADDDLGGDGVGGELGEALDVVPNGFLPRFDRAHEIVQVVAGLAQLIERMACDVAHQLVCAILGEFDRIGCGIVAVGVLGSVRLVAFHG